MERKLFISELKKRISEKRKFIQVVAGPRQVGKTTIINQFLETLKCEWIYEAADAIDKDPSAWLETVWNSARVKTLGGKKEVVLAIDEVQKIANWSEIVKKLWDEDTRQKTNIKVILSGSSRLLIQKGLTESLQGRFELIHVPHWSYLEMKKAFNFTLDQYIFFGGYPGSASLVKDIKRWKNYVRDSIIETSISKDIIMLTTISKPALLRQLFDLGTSYSAQIMPFNKMLGTLTDAGNTVTLSHYLELLGQCGLLGGLQKYSGSAQRSKSSSPKFQVYNNALMGAAGVKSFKEAKAEPELWGRLVESCVGSHLINNALLCGYKLFYWRDGNDEVDYVIYDGERLCAIEVKSGSQTNGRGMGAFKKKFPAAKLYTVCENPPRSSGFISLEEFLKLSPDMLL